MDPNIKRIGKYKSAGDQLLRRDMSEPQREQLTAILDDLYEGFTQQTAASRGKTAQEVRLPCSRARTWLVRSTCISRSSQRFHGYRKVSRHRHQAM